MKRPVATQLPNVVLEPWSAEHKAGLVEAANDRAVWRNLTSGFPHPYTPQDADAWIEFNLHAAPSIHFCVVCERAVAGGIGIIVGTGTDAKTGQFGYWLGRRFRGRGIATAAARAMVEYARSSMDLARLQAPVFEWNPASMRVLEKAGFEREAVLRKSVFKDGQLIDSVMYALILGGAGA
jgi:ribosomal-protein-alanine N-acetyltransferase